MKTSEIPQNISSNICNLDMVAFRLFFDGGLQSGEYLSRIGRIPFSEDMLEIVLICGYQLDVIPDIVGPHFIVCSVEEFLETYTNKKKNYRKYAVVIGEGKQGFNRYWKVLLSFVLANKDICYWVVSDSDEQIPLDWMKTTAFHRDRLIWTERKFRQFGSATILRCVIEDIENCFVKRKYLERKVQIRDLQSGVFALNSDLVQHVSIDNLDGYKWIGDLMVIDKCLEQDLHLETPIVDTSEHLESTLYEEGGGEIHLLPEITVLKMKELVNYFKVSTEVIINEMKQALLSKRESNLFFKDWLNEIENEHEGVSLLDKVEKLYRKTSAEMGIKLFPE